MLYNFTLLGKILYNIIQFSSVFSCFSSNFRQIFDNFPAVFMSSKATYFLKWLPKKYHLIRCRVRIKINDYVDICHHFIIINNWFHLVKDTLKPQNTDLPQGSPEQKRQHSASATSVTDKTGDVKQPTNTSESTDPSTSPSTPPRWLSIFVYFLCI